MVGARANSGASSGASHFDAGPTVHSITILALPWLWRRVTLRSNRAINPFTSVLRQRSGLTQSLPVWKVLIWTWGIAVMSSWFRFRQRLLCGHIRNGHTCKVLVLVWLADAGGLPQSFGPFIFVLKVKWRARLSQQPTSNPKLINIHVLLILSINMIELQNNDAMLKAFFLYIIPTSFFMKYIETRNASQSILHLLKYEAHYSFLVPIFPQEIIENNKVIYLPLNKIYLPRFFCFSFAVPSWHPPSDCCLRFVLAFFGVKMNMHCIGALINW